MKIFVTGGSGFVGGHLIEQLGPHHEVVAMARSERSEELVRRYGAEPIRCELGNVAATDLAGVDVLIHAAAHAEEWGPPEVFWRVNVEGTKQLLAAAQSAGVPRLIFIGTEAALFNGSDLVEIDESTPYASPQRYLYSETKAAAEQAVLGANRDSLQTISIRPRFVWGPRDNSVLPAILRMAESGDFRFIAGGEFQTSTTHVRNLTHAVELALTRGRGGHSYFVADDGERTLKEFLTALARTAGVELPDRSIPRWVARPSASVLELVWKILRLETTPPLTRFAAAMLSSTVTVRTDKARAELGYAPQVSVEQGLLELNESTPDGSTPLETELH